MIVGYHPLKIGENEGTIGRVFRGFPFIGQELVFTEKSCFGYFSKLFEEYCFG